MNKKIKYIGNWVNIEKAIPLFDTENDFASAVLDGAIQTKGRIQDTRSPETLEDFTIIPVEEWEGFYYTEESKSLSQSVSDPSYDRDYTHIKIQRADILKLLYKQRYSQKSNILTNVIYSIYIDLYAKSEYQQFPSTERVMDEIEAKQEQIKCITLIEHTQDRERQITWNPPQSFEKTYEYNSFKNLISKFNMHTKKLNNF